MQDSWFSLLIGAGYFATIILFAVNVIMKRRSVGVTLAWLVLLFAIPVAGIVCYLLFGSRRLGTRRMNRIKQLYPDYTQWCEHLSNVIGQDNVVQHRTVRHKGVYCLAEHTMGIPVLSGNSLQLYHQPSDIINRIMMDIDNAEKCIVMAFYIWEPQGRMCALANAMIAAAKRGVDCVVLLDAVGSRGFLKGEWAHRLKRAGVTVTESLPVGFWRVFMERLDIRNHRKILVIDDAIAWTGSFNLVDPVFFKQDARVGEWIDAMIRIDGVASHVLGAIVYWDQAVEIGKKHESFNNTYQLPERVLSNYYNTDVHIVPSGPDNDREMLQQVLLTAIYESQDELIISTPYFIPDEPLVTALKSAAQRGVTVKLIVPAQNDSKMVYHASRSYYEEMLVSGVQIYQFLGGLLHTKCVLVDRATVLFGTVNLDMRSVWLNFEVTMVVYDPDFGIRISLLMDEYLHQAELVDGFRWKQRPVRQKLLENTMQLLAPLL
ncbi:Cardiolipin synthase A [invertebrate metagenome]|uniref:Cardiolipin synthase A n=1 Tax=invertebrate metagenome TaxID=1711999 RepID=A0A2H9TCK8_9ZZZZ